jgi:hypothetical protein
MGGGERAISGPFSQMRENIGRLIPLSLQVQAQVALASQADVTGRKNAPSRVRVGQYVPAVIAVGMSIIACLRNICSHARRSVCSYSHSSGKR